MAIIKQKKFVVILRGFNINNCKYQIVFAPKYRRQIVNGKIKTDIGTILSKLCGYSRQK